MKTFKVKLSVDTTTLRTINWRPFLFGLIFGAAYILIHMLYAQFAPYFSQTVRTSGIRVVSEKLHQPLNTFTVLASENTAQTANNIFPSQEAPHAYVVMNDKTGQILASQQEDAQLPIASLTKIMTAVVALDLSAADDSFTVTKHASNQVPTKLGVIPGETFTLQELLPAILLTSANDAASVIQEGVDAQYQAPVFVKAMNEKAKFLGLTHTHFDNPQGFDSSDNFSSAHDLAVLAHYALTNYPLIAATAKKDYTYLPANEHHKRYDLYNWNGLLDVYPNVYGLKIGNTDAAGTTNVVVSERDGVRILTVLLGAPGILERDMWTAKLLDWGFSQTAGLTAISVTEEALHKKYATWITWN